MPRASTTNSGSDITTPAGVLKALQEHALHNFDSRPPHDSALALAVQNQLRRVTASSTEELEVMQEIRKLYASLTTVWRSTVDRVKKLMEECDPNFHPLAKTLAKGARAARQVKIRSDPKFALECCAYVASTPDRRFLTNAKHDGAGWARRVGFGSHTCQRNSRSRILSLRGPTTTTATSLHSDVEVQMASDCAVDFLYVALCDASIILERFVGSNWCAAWGTLLAMRRSPSGALIPWDCDCDLLVVPDDYQAFMTAHFRGLRFAFVLRGYRVHVGHEGWLKIFPRRIAELSDQEQKEECRHRIREANVMLGLKLSWGQSSGMATELFQKIQAGDASMEFIGPNTVDIYVAKKKGGVVKADWGDAAEHVIFPTKFAAFGPVQLRAPKGATTLLQEWYGPCWKKPVYRAPITHRKVDLTEHMKGGGVEMEKWPSPSVCKLLKKLQSKNANKNSPKATKAQRARLRAAKQRNVRKHCVQVLIKKPASSSMGMKGPLAQKGPQPKKQKVSRL